MTPFNLNTNDPKFEGNIDPVCLGGVKNEEYIFEGEVSQSRRKKGEETGFDCRWSQDFDHGLSYTEKRNACY